MNRKKISLILLGASFSLLFMGVKTPINVSANTTTSTISRLGGQDRYGTAVNISRSGWTYGANTVILASGEGYADALCAAPLAKKYNAPILLTTRDNISDETINELKRLEVKKVIAIGGDGSISDTVLEQVKSATNTTIERIAGQDRYETSAKVAERLSSNNGKIMLASGEGFADALSAAPIAASKEIPILLTPSKELPSSVIDYIERNDIKTVYVIGGNASVDTSLESNLPGIQRLSGVNRYETNIAVVSKFLPDLDTYNTYVALAEGPTGNEFADALSGAALASKNNAPLLLTYQTVPNVTKNFAASKLSPDTKITALGGPAVVSDDMINQLIIPASSLGNNNDGDTNNNAVISNDNAKYSNGTVSGDLYVQGNNATISNVVVKGTLYIDPGKTGTTNLNTVKAKNIVVRSGAANSIYLNNVTADNLVVESSSNTHIKLQGYVSIGTTIVKSQATLDANSGSFGNIEISPKTDDKNIELKGNFDKDKKISVTNSAIVKIDSAASVPSLEILNTLASDNVILDGRVQNLIINSESRVNMTKNAQVSNIITVNSIAFIKTVSGTQIQNIIISESLKDNVVALLGNGSVTNLQNKSPNTILSIDSGIIINGIIEAANKSTIQGTNTAAANNTIEKTIDNMFNVDINAPDKDKLKFINNSKDLASVSYILKAIGSNIGLDVSVFNKLSDTGKQSITSALIDNKPDGGYINLDTVRIIYDNTCKLINDENSIITKINNGAGLKDISEFTNFNTDLSQVDQTNMKIYNGKNIGNSSDTLKSKSWLGKLNTVINGFGNLSSEEQAGILKEINSKTNYTSIESIIDFINNKIVDSCTLNKINTSTNYDTMVISLTDSGSNIGFDSTLFNKLSDKGKHSIVTTIISNKPTTGYNNINMIKTIYTNAYKIAVDEDLLFTKVTEGKEITDLNDIVQIDTDLQAIDQSIMKIYNDITIGTIADTVSSNTYLGKIHNAITNFNTLTSSEKTSVLTNINAKKDYTNISTLVDYVNTTIDKTKMCTKALQDATNAVNTFIDIGINTPSTISTTLNDGGIQAQKTIDTAKNAGAETSDITALQTKLTNQLNKVKERANLANVSSSIVPVEVDSLVGLPDGIIPNAAFTVINNNISSLDSKFLNQISIKSDKAVTLDVYYKNGAEWNKNTLMLAGTNTGDAFKFKLPLNTDGTISFAIVASSGLSSGDSATLSVSSLAGIEEDYPSSPVILKNDSITINKA